MIYDGLADWVTRHLVGGAAPELLVLRAMGAASGTIADRAESEHRSGSTCPHEKVTQQLSLRR